MNKMASMDVNKCLPPELTIESVDDILYRIGLCFTSIRVRPKRKKLYNPYLIFTFLLLFQIKELFIISFNEENDSILKAIGSLGYILGMRVTYSIIITLGTIINLSSQLIYFYNYKNGIKPTFLLIFLMMSGLIPPKSLGLNNYKEIIKLLKITRYGLKLISWNNQIILPIFGTFCFLGIYSLKCNVIEMLTFGIINNILIIIWAIYCSNMVTYQIFLFYIICLYLKIKINSLNESLLEMKRRKRFIRIRETLQSFDSLYSEINEYNTTFWSKIFVGYFGF